ncbi:unnamed protein product [Heterobilharzia americana]|nr:unnamed protein product [Heterobilharzia americana]
MYVHLRNTVTEESLLVICGYGLQTSTCYFTGRKTYSSFIPMNRIKGFHLIDSVSPFTIHTYLGCECIKPITAAQTISFSSSSQSRRRRLLIQRRQ